MTKVPSIGYGKVIKALQRDGWVVVRQKGSHIRLQKHERDDIYEALSYAAWRAEEVGIPTAA